jgi:hypothetical protein
MLAPEATKILQHLADLMANKQQQPYSSIMELVKALHTDSDPTTQLPIRLPKFHKTLA